MKDNNRFYVNLLHCGSRNTANPKDRLEKSTFYMPMGLFALAAKLKENGIQVEIIHLDLEEKDNIEEILDFSKLDVVGLDCHWINQGLVVLDTVELIKGVKPGVFVVLGGYTASFFAREILNDYPVVDAIIRGDGEVPLVQLCNALKDALDHNKNPWDNLPGVPNLAWRKPGGELILNEFSYIASSRDLNRLDFASLELLRKRDFYRDLCRHWSRFSPINQLPIFFLEIGRGCDYTCIFCGGNANAQKRLSNRKSLSIRSIDSVMDSIKKAVAFGYSHFFASFEFENSEKWYLELFRTIKQEKLKISFGYSSLGLPSKSLVNEFSRVFEHVIIEISPETADPHLRKINKDPKIFYTNEELEACLTHMGTKPNINVQLYFGYLLPFDTRETVFNTCAYISELLLKYSSFTEIIYSNLSTDPCSSLYCHPGKYKVDIAVRNFADYIKKLEETYIIKKEIPYGGMNLFKPRYMTDREAADIKNKAGLFNMMVSCFGHAVELILKRTGNVKIIVDYLKEIDLSMSPVTDFTPIRLKNLLLALCKENRIMDSEITAAIDREFETISLKVMETRQVQLNNSKPKELVIITEKEKNQLRSDIQMVKENIHADFDI